MKILLAVGGVLLLAACGQETEAPPAQADAPAAARPTAVPAADDPVTTSWPVTVLDDGDGAELCLGGVAESYPPQCGGPPLVGWDWSQHAGAFETANGVRWGEFVVTGGFDGTAFTPSEVIPGDEWDGEYSGGDYDFSTPCEEPDGGWVADPALVSRPDMERTFARASRMPDYAYSYVDTSRDGRTPEEMDQDALAGNEDVSLWVVNVRVTGDPAAAEDALRETWGGGLCVSQAQHTDKELEEVQMAMSDVPGFTGSGRGNDRVDLSVTYDDGSIQAWVDQEFGAGVVVVTSALVPA